VVAEPGDRVAGRTPDRSQRTPRGAGLNARPLSRISGKAYQSDQTAVGWANCSTKRRSCWRPCRPHFA
jgi:hypothetical protein